MTCNLSLDVIRFICEHDYHLFCKLFPLFPIPKTLDFAYFLCYHGYDKILAQINFSLFTEKELDYLYETAVYRNQLECVKLLYYKIDVYSLFNLSHLSEYTDESILEFLCVKRKTEF